LRCEKPDVIGVPHGAATEPEKEFGIVGLSDNSRGVRQGKDARPTAISSFEIPDFIRWKDARPTAISGLSCLLMVWLAPIIDCIIEIGHRALGTSSPAPHAMEE
jgi:hypothetical protein